MVRYSITSPRYYIFIAATKIKKKKIPVVFLENCYDCRLIINNFTSVRRSKETRKKAMKTQKVSQNLIYIFYEKKPKFSILFEIKSVACSKNRSLYALNIL